MATIVGKMAKDYSGLFHSNRLYPSIEERQEWNSLDDQLKDNLIAQADEYLNMDYPILSASMYLRFSEDGNRSCYWENYSLRRHSLNCLVIGECVDNQGRYIKSILDGIFAICEESSWVIPAHNTYIRDRKGPVLPDVERPVLEIMSCETGANLALISYLLANDLDKLSSLIRKRIQHELSIRVIKPYLLEHFWWMGRGDEPMNNWTIWCTQNVLHIVSLLEWPQETIKAVYEKATKSMDFFLKEYGEDGCCDEGVIYYRKAGLCLNTSISVLNQMTQGHFQKLWRIPKIINIGDYIRKAYAGSEYFINFADCSAVAGACGGREYEFGLNTANKDLVDFATWSRFNMVPAVEWNMNLYDNLINIFTYKKMKKKYDNIMKKKPVYKILEDDFFPSTGLAIFRDQRICLGLKAGNNADSHNHNDVGSYILYWDDQPFIVDIGVETYSAQTFSKQRYEIWTMQSDYHNLPSINGCMQLPGSQHKAEVLEETITSDQVLIRMDLKKAYPDDSGINNFIRSLDYSKNNSLCIEDSVEYIDQEVPIITNMIFYNQPVVSGKTIKINNDHLVNLEGLIHKIDVEVLKIDDQRLKWSWDHDLYRVRIYWAGTKLRVTIDL